MDYYGEVIHIIVARNTFASKCIGDANATSSGITALNYADISNATNSCYNYGLSIEKAWDQGEDIRGFD
ncbi:MAG: hypothetical protein WA364_15625 [Candidatus Nitrosopolaris sp.]